MVTTLSFYCRGQGTGFWEVPHASQSGQKERKKKLQDIPKGKKTQLEEMKQASGMAGTLGLSD